MGGLSEVWWTYRSSLLSVLGRSFIAIQGPFFERGSWNVCITRLTTGYGHDTLIKRLV
jgi:hypothetical protein